MVKSSNYFKIDILHDLRVPIGTIFGLLLASYLNNIENTLLMAASITSGLLFVATFTPDIKKKYACFTCSGSGKILCPKGCNKGYLGPSIAEYTFPVPDNNFELQTNDPNNSYLRIKELALNNSGRKGKVLQTIVVKALNEEIGRLEQEIDVDTFDEEIFRNIIVPLKGFLPLRENLGKEPPKGIFKPEIGYKITDRGRKCETCDNGFAKCDKCFHGLIF